MLTVLKALPFPLGETQTLSPSAEREIMLLAKFLRIIILRSEWVFLKNVCQLTYDDNSKFIYAVLYVIKHDRLMIWY